MNTQLFERIFGITCLLLPPGMTSLAARNMLVAIAMQESRFKHRAQIGGPAKGFWQFEKNGGVRGVLNHVTTGPLIREVCSALSYEPDVSECYTAIEHNDILACAFARLLLWTVLRPLPKKGEHQKAWEYYIEGWRPGKPHRDTWDAFYDKAWE